MSAVVTLGPAFAKPVAIGRGPYTSRHDKAVDRADLLRIEAWAASLGSQHKPTAPVSWSRRCARSEIRSTNFSMPIEMRIRACLACGLSETHGCPTRIAREKGRLDALQCHLNASFMTRRLLSRGHCPSSLLHLQHIVRLIILSVGRCSCHRTLATKLRLDIGQSREASLRKRLLPIQYTKHRPPFSRPGSAIHRLI
jgi:hypothetical protein